MMYVEHIRGVYEVYFEHTALGTRPWVYFRARSNELGLTISTERVGGLLAIL